MIFGVFIFDLIFNLLRFNVRNLNRLDNGRVFYPNENSYLMPSKGRLVWTAQFDSLRLLSFDPCGHAISPISWLDNF